MDAGQPADSGASEDAGTVMNDGTLPLPGQLDGELVDGVRVFRLNLQEGRVEWVPDNPTDTYGINGTFLGPSLRFRKGERVRIEVTNALQEPTTLHWHGMELPARSDGGPYQIIDPGETWISEYDVIQRPLMAWYHPHQMHETGRQVYMGMAGLIFIDDPSQNIDLPSTYGVDDIPLVVQDRRFESDGRHPYSAGRSLGTLDQFAGLKGDTILVNGAITPEHTVLKGLMRFRILNGSNARNYNFGFSDDRSFQYIGNEGGLLESSITANRVLLSPAERAEILVDFGDDATDAQVKLQSYSGEVKNTLFTGNMGRFFADTLDEQTFDIMTFKVGEVPMTTIVPPTTFEAIPRPLEADADRSRTIGLSMRMGSVFINNERMLSMDSVPAAINFSIASGDTEIWRITNSSGMAHPLHIHNRHFRVLDIDGQAPPAHLAGYKDTILVNPNQVVRVMIEFQGVGDPSFPYMFHCHILEHEDGGMMGQFYIVDP